jgi:predicted solute-binding protein
VRSKHGGVYLFVSSTCQLLLELVYSQAQLLYLKLLRIPRVWLVGAVDVQVEHQVCHAPLRLHYPQAADARFLHKREHTP